MTRARVLLLIAVVVSAFSPAPASACRLFGFVGRHVPEGELAALLTDFGDSFLAGTSWAFGFFVNRDTGIALDVPLLVRDFGNSATFPGSGPLGTWPCGSGCRFLKTVRFLETTGPAAIIGHLRQATTGPSQLPDPHPFHKTLLGVDFLFAHNGTVPDVAALAAKVKDFNGPDGVKFAVLDGSLAVMHGPFDPAWWPDDKLTGDSHRFIDSELVFLYVLEHLWAEPACPAAAIWEAVTRIRVDAPGATLNFVMTDGQTLYAVRWGLPLFQMPDAANPEIRVVATEPLAGRPFVEIPDGTLLIRQPWKTTRSISLASPRPRCP